jgi:hypothetical protein
MTHPDVLQAAAITIYGERWKAPFARDLGVAPRQLYDWMEGRTPVPLRVWIALTLALATQARQAIDLLQQLEEIEAVEADGTIDGASVDDAGGTECGLGAATRALCPWSAAHAQAAMNQPTG